MPAEFLYAADISVCCCAPGAGRLLWTELLRTEALEAAWEKPYPEVFGSLLYTGRLRWEAFAASDDFCMRMPPALRVCCRTADMGCGVYGTKADRDGRLIAPKHAESIEQHQRRKNKEIQG